MEGTNSQTPPCFPPGNQDNTFVIDADSGNLTMAKIVPSAMTFLLLIRVGTGTERGGGTGYLGPGCSGSSTSKALLVTAATLPNIPG